MLYCTFLCACASASLHSGVCSCMYKEQPFIYGFYNRFNNLRFRKSRTLIDYSAAHAVCSFVSSENLKRRLLKWLLDHPMNHVRVSEHLLGLCTLARCLAAYLLRVTKGVPKKGVWASVNTRVWDMQRAESKQPIEPVVTYDPHSFRPPLGSSRIRQNTRFIMIYYIIV